MSPITQQAVETIILKDLPVLKANILVVKKGKITPIQLVFFFYYITDLIDI